MSPKEASTDSLKKAMMKPGVFDEASYYKSEKVQLGGQDDDEYEDEFEDEDEDGEAFEEEE